MKKNLALFALAAAAATTAVPAAAQFAKAEDAIKYRQSSFFVLGQHFARIGAMTTGKVPFDAKVAQENAELVAALAKLPIAGFGPDTDKAAATKAKPQVWTAQAKFKDHADKMVTETTKLAAAANTGDLAQLKAAFGPAAQTCKACHETFKDK